MQVKYQVFISSTFRDLEVERRAVIEQVLNMGHIPVGMELFQAGDESQWAYIQQQIMQCDYYVVIIGERYGSEGPHGKSYTQMEYEFAIAQSVPVAAFLLHEDARKTWPKQHVEFAKAEKVQLFRELCERRMVKYWRDANDLASGVSTSLFRLINTSPRVGWVRSDSVASAAALEEIAKLSEERRLLQERTKTLEEQVTLLRGDGLTVPPDMKLKMRLLGSIDAEECVPMGKFEPGWPKTSVLELFMKVCRLFSVPTAYQECQMAIRNHLRLDSGDVDFILKEFITQRLLDASRSDSWTFLQLSDYGKEFIQYAQLDAAQESTRAEPSG